MRCTCCNRNLNDYESTLKDGSGNYLDTCNKCLEGLGIETFGREDLNPNAEQTDEELEDEDLGAEDLDWWGENDG